jgi:thioredoxin 1
MNIMHVEKLNDLVQIISENEKTIIYFGAPWCGPCKMYGPIFESLSEEHDDVKFVKVDVSNASDISREFGVTNIPMTVFTHNGKESARVLGVQPKNKLKEMI